MGDYNPETGVVDLPPKHILNNKRRLVTIFCYLNDVEKGGYTQFPLLGLNVEPKAGRAVIWQNVLHSGLPDARTVHAGTPVEEGIKYALNIWLCEE
jgi:prolyl 4-hydroxylase